MDTPPEPPETDLADGIRADIILDKHAYVNATDILDHANPDHPIYLAGADTDVCVLENAAALFEQGVDVRVLYDLTYTNGGAEAYANALRLLGRTIGRDQIIRGEH
ncbi:isochorismatase family protein [Bifidobacterium sp. SO1]|uniref:isochorismatase family protein n=1 Tax=Bifidobacterium sp. SO1 TaxID=2809029 RepID=UPI001C2FCD26|nr:isochorismatase family protein [Bifidobacterium sp. SO1]